MYWYLGDFLRARLRLPMSLGLRVRQGHPAAKTLDMLLEGPSGCRTITTRATFAMAVVQLIVINLGCSAFYGPFAPDT